MFKISVSAKVKSVTDVSTTKIVLVLDMRSYWYDV